MNEIGYRGATACNAAGISYRQLDYWARTGLVEPTVRSATGSGSHRLYGFRDILVLKIVKRLLDAGVSLQNIRSAVKHLRERGIEDYRIRRDVSEEMRDERVVRAREDEDVETTLMRTERVADRRFERFFRFAELDPCRKTIDRLERALLPYHRERVLIDA